MTLELCHAVEAAADVNVSGAYLKVLLESFLSKGHACRIRANGSSMTPSIRNGDLVTIEPVAASVRRGDVVASSDMGGGRVLLHRVMNTRGSGSGREFMLAGDNGCAGEDWVGEGCILGQVRRVSRGDRNVFLLGGLFGLVWAWVIHRACRWRRGRTRST
jgi:hypothetical protein